MTNPTPEPTPTEDEDIPRFAFLYDPKNGEHQEWEFDPTDWTVGEMKTAERIYRRPRDEILADVNEGYDDAKVLLLWLLRRRTEPDLLLADLDSMQTGALHLVQLIPDEPDADDAEPDDPEPDGVNDPKDGSSGGNAKPSETQSEPPSTLAG